MLLKFSYVSTGGGVFGWLKGSRRVSQDPLVEWRAACAAALSGDEALDPAELRRRLETASATAVDTEMELEMLDALERLQALRQTIQGGELPHVETHHRVVGGDRCHFTAPASLPEGGHAAGRVLLTSSRAIFVGSGRTAVTPWHAIRDVVRLDRDLVLARAEGPAAAQFRFNTYGDAVECAYLARHLKTGGKRRL